MIINHTIISSRRGRLQKAKEENEANEDLSGWVCVCDWKAASTGKDHQSSQVV